MPGCSAALADSMTGSTDLGPIQPQQDSVPLLDDNLFGDGGPRRRFAARQPPRPARRRMSPSTVVQLTPIWEYVVRTRKFPKNEDPLTIFEEISERLRDPEWEVRQHALRVLVDLLPIFGPEVVDDLCNIVLSDLVDNLGHPAPGVRKGSLDALRIYLLHSPRREEMTIQVLREGLNRPTGLDDYHTSVATGVILSTPLLLFPSRSSARPSGSVVREAVQALAVRLVQVTQQEAALRSLARIREVVGAEELHGYLDEVDDSMRRNFELLCDVYGVRRNSPSRRRASSRSGGNSGGKSRRKSSRDVSAKHSGAVEKSWESEDSDTSGIAEEDEDGLRSGSGSISSARIVLETEIKFNEETAITMTILEEQEKDTNEMETEEEDEEEDEEDLLDEQEAEISPEERRKTPRRVHFGGEVVKLRTPDSEDTESILSDGHLQPPRTRIPVPVTPATRPPRPRARSSSQPTGSRRRKPRERRSASSSPRREVHVHDANLSPKKSILARSSLFAERLPSTPELEEPRGRVSRRDSVTPSPRITDEEPSFRVCEEPNSSPTMKVQGRSPSPSVLGEACDAVQETTQENVDSIFGDRSGIEFREKSFKDKENLIRSGYRSSSALGSTSSFDWNFDKDSDAQTGGKERRRSQSAKIPGFDVFPRQERNYILMELSSPVKELSRRTSLEDGQTSEFPKLETDKLATKQNDLDNEKQEDAPDSAKESTDEKQSQEPPIDSNKTAESQLIENETIELQVVEPDEQLGVNDENLEKSALDTRERSSDSSSDGEWRNKEPNWEELGLVDDEILDDFHNKEDWRARVRGLERIASALRSPSTLANVEPRVGSLLHAVLGGERSCRVAAAGLTVAKVVLSGVSEEALKERLSLIAWGLARQGGPNAAHLARLTMLRTSPGLFLQKLLQPQCVAARNAKTRENTLQLLIFSLVTFPSTEFKVKSAIDRVIAMVGDRRKRVRHAALDTLAVISQIYESENILEASQRIAVKQDGPQIQAAIKTRLARKLLPTVSVDGLVIYGLQISSSLPHTGADVDWIVAGSGSVSPGAGRTRGQLIAMSKVENGMNEQNNVLNKHKVRPSSEHINTNVGGLLEKTERTSSWRLLPQSSENDTQNQEIKSKKIGRTSKSADLSKVDYHEEESVDVGSNSQKPYATPKRDQIVNEIKSQRVKSNQEYFSQIRTNSIASVPRQESRIPIYTGDRNLNSKVTNTYKNGEMSNYSQSNAHVIHRQKSRFESSGSIGYMEMNKSRKHHTPRSTVPSTNRELHEPHLDEYTQQRIDKLKKFKEEYQPVSIHSHRENTQRILSYEKISKGFDTAAKSSRSGLNEPHHQFSSKSNETAYESIYQRQGRLKEQKETPTFEAPPNLFYGHNYERYTIKKNKGGGDKSTIGVKTEPRSPQKRSMFISPFDEYMSVKSTEISDKEAGDEETDSSADPAKPPATRAFSGNAAAYREKATTLQRQDPVDRSSISSSSSNRSAASSRKLRSIQTLASHTEIVEPSGARNSPLHRPRTRSFDVISTKSEQTEALDAARLRTPVRPQPDTPPPSPSRTEEVEEEPPSSSGSEGRAAQSTETASSVDSREDRAAALERRLSELSLGSSALRLNGFAKGSASPTAGSEVALSSPARSTASLEGSLRLSERRLTLPQLTRSGFGDEAERRSRSSSPKDEEDGAFKTLDFRKPVEAAAHVYDNVDSNATLYSCSSIRASPKVSKRFVNEEPRSKDTDSEDNSPLPIGFDGANGTEVGSYASDESDDASLKPQPSRLPTPVDLPKKWNKMSPCIMRPSVHCQRSAYTTPSRHGDKHLEKSSKAVQQCFGQLESKDWEMTLKGLRTLSQIARDDPEQLDACAPGVLARVLGKHVKNLRSQVARVACSAASEVFSAHVRGIDQDLDEVAGPLLHRTADTNRFLREDCNVALNSMVEHVPPYRTILTVANRGASHQNTVVHATTARLLNVIVNEIGGENIMNLPRDVKDKLFATNAKLLTDGNLQARKHAKETFRLLSRCEGFRRALTDAVPESTLRLIDKTLRTL